MRPLVTIVTPSLNQARFIREAIESVLTQTYPRIEYLVMDGGSTDETVSILKEYGSRVAWVSEPDAGQADAVNRGWQRGHGDIVAYLNSDDAYFPTSVERAVEALRAHPDAPGVYGNGYHTDAGGQIIASYPTEDFSVARLAETCFICQPTVFLRHDAVRRVAYMDPSLNFCMDYDLWIRLGRLAPLHFIPDYLAKSRLHSDTKTLGQRVPAHREILAMIRRHFGYVPPTWAYAYANAMTGSPIGATRSNPIVIANILTLTMITFVRYNITVAPWRWRGWIRWIRQGAQRARTPRG